MGRCQESILVRYSNHILWLLHHNGVASPTPSSFLRLLFLFSSISQDTTCMIIAEKGGGSKSLPSSLTATSPRQWQNAYITADTTPIHCQYHTPSILFFGVKMTLIYTLSTPLAGAAICSQPNQIFSSRVPPLKT